MPSSPRRRRPRLTATASRIRRTRVRPPAPVPVVPPSFSPSAPPVLPPGRRRGWVLPVAALVVGVAALGSLWFTSRSLAATEAQLALSARTQVAQRFTEAVGQLGSDKLDVRLGAIYGLDGLIRDSAQDAPRGVEVLTAFVRTRAPIENCGDGATAQALQRPAEDVQAAVTVIGRRGSPAGDRLNLTRACLAGADLHQAQLDRADLSGTDLSRANLARAKLRSADLSDGVLVQTDFTGADLRREDSSGAAWTTRLRQANLTGANLTSADLSGADLSGAELTSAQLTGANLTGADLREATGLS
ncbi:MULTISPECIES: pentapeptide repeat-containing protein [unclassified Crossiella]|uniref:pentapeptide repeat-containing protein n=1 Tax=unclassified Crossiella TaxID=2620835 RepID=UPI0020004331|nr:MULTISPECIES: pentapeptide repeat-containing protein [unclassified Crossiella]MCK2242903.1 pentapeptide repeat-containing protein [Crossiella sp. S99.2]MCK2256780.1 pentapeptide repeat-containing protein [Crossiella sp. S99.1]